MGSFLAPRARLLPLALLLLCLLARVQGQFPRDCPFTLVPLTRTRCCPEWPGDGSACGSASGRGTCQQGPLINPIPSLLDKRLGYPWGLYTHICNCTFPYAGPNCGSCTYNRGGSNCNTTYNVVRKDLSTLSSLELSRFQDALFLAKSTRSDSCVIFTQRVVSGILRYQFVNASMYDCLVSAFTFNAKYLTLAAGNNLNLRGPAFPTFNRWLELELEKMLQTVLNDPTFGLPYWDWRFEVNTCNICFPPFLGGSPYANWKVICEDSDENDYCTMSALENLRSALFRDIGAVVGTLPTAADVSACLRWTAYDTLPYNTAAQSSFRNALEGFINSTDGVTPATGMYNRVHLFVGGDMLSPMVGTSDPVFHMHHCMIDSVFDGWIIKYGATSATYPVNTVSGQGADDYIVGSFPPVRNRDMIQPLANFGSSYQYRAPLDLD